MEWTRERDDGGKSTEGKGRRDGAVGIGGDRIKIASRGG